MNFHLLAFALLSDHLLNVRPTLWLNCGVVHVQFNVFTSG